jgi:hypothetical protein
MHELLESIRAAIVQGATADHKAAGAQACRTILTALEAEVGRPLMMPGAPMPGPLAGIDPTHALDLLIARLQSVLPAERTDARAIQTKESPGLRIPMVGPPPGVPRKGKP